MTQDELIKIAKEYLENQISIKDLAAKYGLSKTSLIRYFKGEGIVTLPRNLQEKINDKKIKRFQESKSTSGNKGHLSLSVLQIQNLAKEYVNGDELSLRDVAAFNKVNPSTIYNLFTLENLGEELYEQVVKKYQSVHPSGGSRKV